MKCSRCDKEASYSIEWSIREASGWMIPVYIYFCKKHFEEIKLMCKEDTLYGKLGLNFLKSKKSFWSRWK